MIPQRMLSNEISGSELRNRVTACRKRLRESRVMLKAHANTRAKELFPEAASSLIPLHDQAGDELGEQIAKQEVGIT